MKDAYGGILNIVFLVVFFLIVEGVLGLIVNYTKAFKMKNNVISTIEQYEGSGCFKNGGDTACVSKITERAKRIGYHPTSLNCPNKYENINGLFCYRKTVIKNAKSKKLTGNKPSTYRIITQVDINFPLIDKVLGFNFFQVSGDTEIVEHQDVNKK